MRGRLLVVALAGIPFILGAQEAPERAALQRLQDSLVSVHDTLALRRLDRWLETGAGGTARGGGLLLRRSLIRIRMGQLGDGWNFGSAQRLARQATRTQPDWPAAWYLSGLASQELGRWRAETGSNLGTRVGFSALEGAAQQYLRALQIDPGYLPALRALSEVASVLQDTTLIGSTVLPAFRHAGATESGGDASILLARGRYERLMGDADSSLAALRGYAEKERRSGVALHELAWSAALAGDSDAVRSYYEGAAFDDSAAVAAYRSDLELLADDSTLQAFDSTHGEARTEFLQRFWTLRDRRDLRTEGQRLIEHFRRLTYAERHFALLTNRRWSSIDDIYRSPDLPFDDRGMVYLRQGKPDEVIHPVLAGMGPNETWVYRRGEGDLLLHFKGGGAYTVGGDIQDYRLVRSIFELGAGSDAQVEMLLASRADLLDVYAKFLNWGQYARARAVDREQDIVEGSIEVATVTDANARHYRRSIAAAADAVAVGEIDRSPLVHLVLAVPLQDEQVDPNQVHLPVRIRVGFYNAAGVPGPALDRDTVLRVRRTEDGLQAQGRLEFVLPPGAWLYRVSVETTDSTGGILPEDSVRVEAVTGSPLSLSGIALGTRSKGVEWVAAPGDTAVFNPSATFDPADQVEMYFEAYGLETTRPVRAEVRITQGKRDALRLSYEQPVSGAPLRVRRSLEIANVKPGKYRLEVRVVTEDGEEASTAREIEVKRRTGRNQRNSQ
ncbi:MAG TPA: GWxTD domain-containing protein [Gemmatimonadales bacterium]|jgi:GWxTD domain-containing protein